jgi:hypothetical protein
VSEERGEAGARAPLLWSEEGEMAMAGCIGH